MTERPCRPSADLKRLWRTLLPGTPFPACGMPDESADEGSPAGAAVRSDAGTPAGAPPVKPVRNDARSGGR